MFDRVEWKDPTANQAIREADRHLARQERQARRAKIIDFRRRKSEMLIDQAIDLVSQDQTSPLETIAQLGSMTEVLGALEVLNKRFPNERRKKSDQRNPTYSSIRGQLNTRRLQFYQRR